MNWPYVAPRSLATISKMVRARREWWAAKKQSGAASANGVKALRGGCSAKRGAAPLFSRAVEDWNASGTLGDAAADAARPASLSAASHSASAPARNHKRNGVRGG